MGTTIYYHHKSIANVLGEQNGCDTTQNHLFCLNSYPDLIIQFDATLQYEKHLPQNFNSTFSPVQVQVHPCEQIDNQTRKNSWDGKNES